MIRVNAKPGVNTNKREGFYCSASVVRLVCLPVVEGGGGGIPHAGGGKKHYSSSSRTSRKLRYNTKAIGREREIKQLVKVMRSM